jgi:FkbM family methyltransferase
MFLDRIKALPHAEGAVFAGLKQRGAVVALFGAGTVAAHTLRNLRAFGVDPACICDNNPQKQGRGHLGLPVLSYPEFKARHPGEHAFVLSVSNMAGLQRWLLDQGERAQDVIAFGDFRDPYSARTDADFVRANAGRFEEVYAALADGPSRDLLVDLVNCKLTGDNGPILKSRTHDQYFDAGIVKLAADEVFVDAGAFTGDTVDAFVKASGGAYERIVALEPDPVNHAALAQHIAAQGIARVELRRLGAWNKADTLSFNEEQEGVSRIADPGAGGKLVSIQVDSLDHILAGGRVSFIKMDIEGAERNALLGAEASIRAWAPRLAVAVYHKREDLYDLPLLLRSLVPSYKLYLRNYTDTAADTVLYAVPGAG